MSMKGALPTAGGRAGTVFLAAEDGGGAPACRQAGRLLRGEDLDSLSRELQVTAARLSEWREAFLAGGQANLKSRQLDARDEENAKLKALVGDLAMRNELLQEANRRLQANLPFPRRRSSP